MGSTSNYSWPTPEQTDLVKDGWDAIKDLGDAADTTVKAVSDAQGLIHIDTVTFSAVASQSFDDIFSATYTNYKVLGTLTTTGNNINLRLRENNTDQSGSNYTRQSSAFTTVDAYAQTTGGNTYGLGGFSTNLAGIELTFFNPFGNTPTGISAFRNTEYNGTPVLALQAGGYSANYSADGFTLTPNTGTISGTLFIYGLRD